MTKSNYIISVKIKIMAISKIYLRNKKGKDGKYPVVIRITKDRKSKIITLLRVNLSDWDEKNNKLKRKFKNENLLLEIKKGKVDNAILNFKKKETEYTIEDIVREIKESRISKADRTNKTNLIVFIDETEKHMIELEKFSSAKTYRGTKNSLIKFKGNNIDFKDVTVDFLEKYEVFLRKNGNSDGGVAFKMRELRSIYNKAINKKLISKDIYPFNRYKISKLKTKNIKLALTKEELKKLKNVDLSLHPHLADAYRYFFFSFYARGINFKDMMELKWENIKNNEIQYTRSKTKKNLRFQLISEALEIIDYYRAQKRETDYVFPILLNNEMTAQQKFNRREKVLRKYNKSLKEIGKIAGLDKPLHSYVARHSFATFMKMEGVSVEKISEMLGHSNVLVTTSYLKDFDDEKLFDANKLLLDI